MQRNGEVSDIHMNIHTPACVHRHNPIIPSEINEPVLIKCRKVDKSRVAEINVRGANDTANRTLLDRWGIKKRMDVMCSSEVKVNSNWPMKTTNTHGFSVQTLISETEL